jgi:hypothetical protein
MWLLAGKSATKPDAAPPASATKNSPIKTFSRRSATTGRYHFRLEGDYELGDTAVPELPCWTLGEQVVEKGLAEVIRT